jgi:hypothetical protein
MGTCYEAPHSRCTTCCGIAVVRIRCVSRLTCRSRNYVLIFARGPGGCRGSHFRSIRANPVSCAAGSGDRPRSPGGPWPALPTREATGAFHGRHRCVGEPGSAHFNIAASARRPGTRASRRRAPSQTRRAPSTSAQATKEHFHGKCPSHVPPDSTPAEAACAVVSGAMDRLPRHNTLGAVASVAAGSEISRCCSGWPAPAVPPVGVSLASGWEKW